MTIQEQYLNQVVAHLPPSTPLRSQIVLELRSLINERIERGGRVEDVLRQLGDPKLLAESYLNAVPLVSASFGVRALARIVDVLAVVSATVLMVLVAARLLAGSELLLFAFPFGLLFGVLLYVTYAIAAEYWTGQTLGKRLFHIRVVRESGARIGLGQAIVRQLPTLMQFFWIDILFALFTDRRQRAFELLSKTRVVEVPAAERVGSELTMSRTNSLA